MNAQGLLCFLQSSESSFAEVKHGQYHKLELILLFLTIASMDTGSPFCPLPSTETDILLVVISDYARHMHQGIQHRKCQVEAPCTTTYSFHLVLHCVLKTIFLHTIKVILLTPCELSVC